MTELQISLIVIGAIIIIGVIVYNKIQEHRAKKRLEQVFSDDSDDILMSQSSLVQSLESEKHSGIYNHTVAEVNLENTLEGDDTISLTTDQDEIGEKKIEPYLEDESTEQEQSVQEETAIQASRMEDSFAEREETPELMSEQKTVVEPVFEEEIPPQEEVPQEEAPQQQETESIPSTTFTRRFVLDDIIDQSVLVNLKESVRADKILPFAQKLRRIGNKAVHFVGIANEPAPESLWQPIVPGKFYQRLKVGIQIANRTGPLNEIEFSDFVAKVTQLANEIGGNVIVPKSDVVLQNAKSLFKFVESHDARLGINVKSIRPWPIATLVQALEKSKLKKVNNDLFVLQDENNSVLFSLTINVEGASDAASSLTLILDVPCVPAEKQAFISMVRVAKDLARRLRGTIVDDAGRMLSDPMLNDIAHQVDVFYGEMKAASIDAGSSRALRLFN